ncbi:bifunctional glutamate--cysteine ligase GshA/glutathione synthetase GshB [Geothrix sp. 21YS21S-2]|uniref:bifunctional glutamate--cysteine ligase GshA/glutathione synthetase GshB n=1 Tax=Geothrix sp. 21YS21S-2 TaxID=3068893 RepID=UPI0027B927E0|nr:bifunctional glutamate--cysteine ligase GshA/glutathione synthetase GshB [Geothrix sp. 21YS21S-2]
MHWTTPGYEELELSTQLVIREAQARGHAVEVLDAPSNFIRIRGAGRVEYLRQATRTSADTYVSPLIMENKKVTKLLLAEAGIRVPEGGDYASLEAAGADFPRWRSRGTVVKPNTTNFGIGVSMLPAPVSEAEYLKAVETALAADGTILVEELIPGREFRFLVIGDAVRAILHRVPARVLGDGRHSVAELIAEKNEDPLRGKGYRSPLEKLRTGPEEAAHLRLAGLTFASVPEAGREVELRPNSNISTGGDSLDFTDRIHPGYSELAVAAAAAVGARICGVDMLIEDVEREPSAATYGVIELNFNPALHIHDFPFEGENRRVERHVLDLLEL